MDPERRGTSHPGNGNGGGSEEAAWSVLGEYLDRLNAGESVDLARIEAEHPEHASEIIARLKAFEALGGEAEGPRALERVMGDYVLLRRLGRGGMGVVYEALQQSMERRVALKVLPGGLLADLKAVARFEREARIAGKLHHPNVVSVHGIGVDDNTPYYAMEFVDGETLAQVLARLRAARERAAAPGEQPSARAAPAPRATALDTAEIDARYCFQVAAAFAGAAEGLQHAHAHGVIHRDLKPSNLILDREGRLRILDFGLARLEGLESLTWSSDFVGTPLYTSPEQARARKVPIDHRTDIYSLGATLYEAITWQPPFRGSDPQDTLSQILSRDPLPPRRLNPRIPKDLETMVLKCLRKNPGERYGTAEALAQDLRRFVRGDPIEARPQRALERLARSAWRQRGRAAVALGAVLLALATGALYWRHRLDAQKASADLYRDQVTAALMRLQLGALTLQAEAGGSPLLDPQEVFAPGDFAVLVREEGLNPVEDGVARLAAAAHILPARPEAHYHRGRGLALLGRGEEALADLDRALVLAPWLMPARTLRDSLAAGGARGAKAPASETWGHDHPVSGWGAAWLEAHRAARGGQWEEAAAAYDRLLAAAGGGEPYLGCALEFHMGKAAALLKSGKLFEAIEGLAAARLRWPRSPEPQILLGFAYLRKGEPDQAERVFRELHARQEEFQDESVLWIAALLKFSRQYERGLEWAERAKDDRIRLRLRTDFLNLLDRFDEAARTGREATARFPDDKRAHHFLAVALLEDPRTAAEGLAVARRAHELDPGRADTVSLLAAAYESNGDLERAQELCRQAIAMAPAEPRAHDQLAQVLFRLGKYAESEACSREAMRVFDRERKFHFLNPHLNFARRLCLQGRLDEAIALFPEAAQVSPRELAPHANLGQALKRQGKLEEAEKAFRRALAIKPDSGPGRRELGLVLWLRGKREEALDELRRAARGASGDAAAAEALGGALEETGELAEAFAVDAETIARRPRARGALLRLLRIQERVGTGFAREWDRLARAIEESSPPRDDPESLTALAAARLHGLEARDPLQARERALALAEKTERRQAEVLGVLADALLELGELAAAAQALEEALSLPRSWKYLAEKLARLRGSAREQARADGPDTERVRDAAGSGEAAEADRRWLLDRLAAGEAVRIDCGREGAPDPGPDSLWSADRFCRGGYPFRSDPVRIREAAAAGGPAASEAVYRTARLFSREDHEPGYFIPIPAGSYRLTLHFAEIQLTAPVPRRFDVLAGDRVLLADFDPCAPGYATAGRRTFRVEVGATGLHLRFIPRQGEALASGIEIAPER
jgi:serine/threonine protein kinase/Flp pilus assembly protein TadD